MTFNIHALTHACDFISWWGPLWAYSAYGFEDGIGRLLKLFNGTQAVEMQITNKYISHQKIKSVTSRLVNSTVDSAFISIQKKLLGEFVPTKKSFRHDDQCVFIGKGFLKTLSEIEKEVVSIAFPDFQFNHNVRSYEQLIYQNEKFTVASYKTNSRRKDCYIQLHTEEICKILYFLTLSHSVTGESKVVVFAQKLYNSPEISRIHLFHVTPSHYFSFSPSQIVSKCVLLSSSKTADTVSVLANLLDRY